MANKQLVDVTAAKAFIDANWPNDPLLKRIGFNLLDKLPKAEPPAGDKWIPTAERLPNYYDHVLINSPGDKPFNTVHEAHLRKDGMWDTGLYRYGREDVTHWMPLPEPPEEDKA